MYALLVSAALLGSGNDDWFDNHMERANQRRIAEWNNQTQRQVSYETQAEDRTNTYIIAGAVLLGLVLLGIIARGGKK